jgi:cell filamentation protein
MTDPIDLAMTGAVAFPNMLGITESVGLSSALANFAAFRLVELQTSPICGGFDSAHLQGIHRHLFQDIFDWAGELRGIGDPASCDFEKPLVRVFDQLARENHLKGLSPDDWAQRAAGYVYELGALQPFSAGNDIALREFAAELARKNDLNLHWNETPLLAGIPAQAQQEQQAVNIRRMIMLAMDTNAGLQRPCRGTVVEQVTDRLLSLDVVHL